jgi:hypothetical protein
MRNSLTRVGVKNELVSIQVRVNASKALFNPEATVLTTVQLKMFYCPEITCLVSRSPN